MTLLVPGMAEAAATDEHVNGVHTCDVYLGTILGVVVDTVSFCLHISSCRGLTAVIYFCLL